MSFENKCEQVEVLLLLAQAELQTFQVKRHDENTSALKDRLVVKALPRETELFSPDGLTPLVIKIPVDVTMHLVTRDAAQMDQLITAVAAAQSSDASGALALAQLSFPNGCFIRLLDGGERDTSKNTRTCTRTMEFVIQLAN